MNDDILLEAISCLDTDLIEKHLKIREQLNKKAIEHKTHVIKRTIMIAVCAVLVLTICGCVPNSDYGGLPVAREEIVCDISGGYSYLKWEGLDISTELELLLNSYSNNDKYFFVNAFRRNGKNFFIDFAYEGKTLKQYSDEQFVIGQQIDRLLQLIEHYGEILKYDKSILTTTGIPANDPYIKYESGVVWTEGIYNRWIEYFNEIDPETLSRYIVNGDFLADAAQRDYDEFIAKWAAMTDKQTEAAKAFFEQHEAADMALFNNAGVISGEINGKLYIIATREQLAGLNEIADISAFSFRILPRDDLYAAYPDS